LDRAQPDTLPAEEDATPDKNGGKAKKGKKTKEDKAKPFAEQLKDDKDVKSDEGGKEKAKGVKKEKEEDKEEKAEKASEKEDKAEKRSISKKPLDGKPGKANIATKDSTSEAHKEAEQAEDDSKQVDAEFIGKFHSSLRWGKSKNEVQTFVKDAGLSKQVAARAADPKTGNQALHISVQNGHRELTEMLITWKADVRAQNFKGQTPLHMSVEYDFYFISKLLLEKGAEREVENADGCKAILGISGSKEGAEAWDAPTNILKNASTKEELSLAFDALEAAEPSSLDKASLARVGMMKAKEMKDAWDKPRFMDFMNKV